MSGEELDIASRAKIENDVIEICVSAETFKKIAGIDTGGVGASLRIRPLEETIEYCYGDVSGKIDSACMYELVVDRLFALGGMLPVVKITSKLVGRRTVWGVGIPLSTYEEVCAYLKMYAPKEDYVAIGGSVWATPGAIATINAIVELANVIRNEIKSLWRDQPVTIQRPGKRP